jgi:hypothetical protein
MEQSPSCETNRFSGSQDIPRILWKEHSLPRLKVRATCPYSEPDQSSPFPHPTSLGSIIIIIIIIIIITPFEV